MNAALIGLFMITLAAGAQNVPATTDNDDSCEITVAPAATLLLPFFDVNVTERAGRGDTTVFTVTNVTSAPQIAHVTVWTDWAYPVLTFNVFLTAYDLQTIDLWDVFARGIIGPRSPGEAGFIAGRGAAPGPDDSNPNIHSCDERSLPKTLPPELLNAVQRSLTIGLYYEAGTAIGCGSTRVGGTHTNARGYVTIDVVADCTSLFPNDPAYYSTEILFDNALIGDYQQINGDTAVGNLARGNPMVHIRAIPEGGPAGSVPPGTTNLPYTFYDRYTPAANRKIDRRIPLPSLFAARWIEGGTSGFQTTYKIWREGVAVGTQTTTCSGAALNSAMNFGNVIRFDERENSFGYSGCLFPVCFFPRSPASLAVQTFSSALFPTHVASPDISGWMFLNLDNGYGGVPIKDYTSPPGYAPARPSQNWIVISVAAQGRYAFDFDAAHLGNGCSAAGPWRYDAEIGPAPNVTP